MNNYFVWDGSPDIFSFGVIQLPIGISVFGLGLAVILYFAGTRLLLKSGQQATTKSRRRKKNVEQDVEVPIWYTFGLIVVSLVIGQLIGWMMGTATIDQIGPVSVRWYGALFALSFLLGYYIGSKTFEHAGKPVERADALFMYLIIGTVLGARLGHVLFYDFDYYIRNLHEVFYFWQGGLASHGALIGVLTSIWIFTRKHVDCSFIWVADRMALPFALGGTFVRIGNFFNSEILGKATEVSWAVIFVSEDLVPRHPSMLYEAVFYFSLFLIMVWVYNKYRNSPPSGALTGMFMTGIFLGRFLIEFTKERQPGFDETLTFLSMGQILSIPLVVIGIWILTSKVDWKVNRQ